MIQAVVYTSNTGTTQEYAQMLGKRISMPVMELGQAVKELDEHAQIIYLGWIMAGAIQGYDRAVKQFAIPYVCAVGMSGEADIEKMRSDNHLSEGTDLLVLQGGYRKDRLKGFMKLMMSVIVKGLAKQLRKKETLTASETDLLNMLEQGGDRVREEALEPVIQWYKTNQKTSL
ncbi:MAG: hypothetical protein ACI32N_06430 [Bulleidia sp.]